MRTGCTPSPNEASPVRETTFPLWVVDCDFRRHPTVREYVALRTGEQSATVLDGGRTVVVKSASGRSWFTDKEAAKAHLRVACARLKSDLEAELAKVSASLAEDKYPVKRIDAEAPPPVVLPPGWLDDA